MSVLKHTYESMTKHRADLKKEPNETPRQHRERVLAIVAREWGFAAASLPAYLQPLRTPDYDKHPKLFDAVKKYGRAQFAENGKIVKESLNQGPDVMEFLREHRRAVNEMNASRDERKTA